jgi:exopolysaccharide biosynthesis polyprenyl glycosylphosphotransferase
MRGTVRSGYLGGLVTLVLVVAAIHAWLIAPDRYDLLRSSRLAWWVVVALVLVAGSYGLGLPELPTRRREAAGRAAAATLLAIGAVSFSQLVVAGPLLPRSSLGLLVVLVPLWSVVGWNLARDAASWQAQRDQVLLVADKPEEEGSLRSELASHPETPAAVVGAMPVADARLTADGRAPLIEAAERCRPTLVVLDTSAQSDDGIVQQVAELHRRGVRVRTLALFYEGWLGKLPVAELARVSLLFDIGELHRLRYVRAKRVIDVALGLAGTLALAPVAAAVLAGNRFANRGPLLFRQLRVGKDGTTFTILKFRTMLPSQQAAGPSVWTTEDDPRITPLGRLLRRSHIDELPQVINVLKGELSIVGPRPEQPGYVEELVEKIPFFDIRHLVRPGLTGWAQVKQGYAIGEADALEKLQYDVFYLRRQGLALDMRIIWRTVRGVIGRKGR